MWGFTECQAVSKLLWNYTTHRLSEGDVERVERHLGVCGPCRAAMAAYQQATDGIASLRRQPVPDSRRGWHELQTRLAAPQRRQSAARPRWGMPTLAWGTMAAAGVLFFTFFSHPIANNTAAQVGSERGMPQDSEANGGNMQQSDTAAANTDAADLRMDDVLSVLTQAGGAEPSASADHRAPQVATHLRRRPMRIAYAAPAATSSTAGTARRAGLRLDYNRMDGSGAPTAGDNRDYVLTPVSTPSDTDSNADYVMGGVVMTNRSSDTEVAHGW